MDIGGIYGEVAAKSCPAILSMREVFCICGCTQERKTSDGTALLPVLPENSDSAGGDGKHM